MLFKGVLYAIHSSRCGVKLLIKHEVKLSALSRNETHALTI